MHMVFQSAAEEIAVVGVYIDVDVGSNTALSSSRVPLPPSSRRGLQIMPHAAVNESKPFTSVMLETLFSSVEEIAVPGTKTTTRPLIMSELVKAVSSGNLKACVSPPRPAYAPANQVNAVTRALSPRRPAPRACRGWWRHRRSRWRPARSSRSAT